MNIRDERIKYFELHNDKWDKPGLREFIHKPRRTFIGFNSLNYDLPVLAAALKRNVTNKEIKAVSDAIIVERIKYWQMDLNLPNIDHIDVMPPAPATEDDSQKSSVMVGLKTYGGRMHSRKLQDLPLPPDSIIEDTEEMKSYCINDLHLTKELYEQIKPRIDLRTQSGGKQYRSKSDAQMAEAILRTKLNESGVATEKTKAPSKLKYTAPTWIKYEKDYGLKQILSDIQAVTFNVLPSTGKPEAPKGKAWILKIYNSEKRKHEEDKMKRLWSGKYKEYVNGLKYLLESNDRSSLTLLGIQDRIYDCRFKIGMGGLHSQEKGQTVIASSDELLFEIDFASFYPHIMVREGFYPKHLTSEFVKVYGDLMDKRLAAKRSGDEVVNQGYKIAINGSFGKMGERFSFLYSPELLLQVTITGQLILLMLIEKIELAGGKVVSANTDGIVVWCHKSTYNAIYDAYLGIEMLSGIELEETRYKAIYSQSVNSYIAIKEDGSCKGKGAYGKPGLTKSPDYEICAMAVREYLVNGTPLYETIHNNRDIRNFVKIRKVKGGAMYKGELIGKLIRFYHSGEDAIYDAVSGNQVATSKGCKPLMELPDEFPEDVNLSWYVGQASKMLKGLGV